MSTILKGIIAWCITYLVILVCFIVVASIMAAGSHESATAFGSSDLLASATLLAKLACAAVPGAAIGRISGKPGIIVAGGLTVLAFVLAQILPGGFLVFSIFSGEPAAMAAMYVVVAMLSAAVMVRFAGRESRNKPAN